jgi:hypothetical protein
MSFEVLDYLVFPFVSERDHYEDQDVGGWIILGWILERWDGVM